MLLIEINWHIGLVESVSFSLMIWPHLPLILFLHVLVLGVTLQPSQL